MSFTIQPTNITTAEFLGAFYSPDETVNLIIYSDRDDKTFKGVKHSVTPAEFDKSLELLNRHNAAHRAIAFIVNKGGFKGEDITEVKSLFVEIDDASFDEQLARLHAFPVEPSIIVKTRKSLHTYWLVNDVSPNEFSALQKSLVAQFGGDGNCVNKNRAMRLPGFYHSKQEPLMVECVKFSLELRYDKAQIIAHLPDFHGFQNEAANASAPNGGAISKPLQKGIALVGKRCAFIQHCKANAATLGENDWYAMITNLAVFEGGDKIIHALSKTYPSYTYAETQDKITHFLASGTKPITCARIAECGFKCPRLENAGCDCKSPAGLAFKPLSTAELLENLNNLEKRGSVLENIQAAAQFIQDCLYNVDAPTAETLIQSDLKARFDFKSANLAPLIKLYRELAKKYNDGKEARRQQTENGEQGALPPWYEVNEKGGLRFLPGVLAGHLRTNVAAFYSAGQYYLYSDGVYNNVTELEAKAVVRNHLIERHATMNNINDAEGQWRVSIIRRTEELNADPYIINLKNGLYNIITDALAAHNTEYCSTVQLNVNYAPNAACPTFLKYLGMSYNTEDIPLVQEMFGYFLVPVTKAQKAFVIVGAPGAGKSLTLLTLNKILLGQKNVANVMWQSLNERFKTAELFGKYGNIFADLPSKAIDDNGMFKALVGEDFITAERKGKDPFTFQSYARLLFSCNSIPRNYGDKSEGFYRRLIIIPFAGKQLPEDKKDVELLDKLQAEADGIFMFALEGLKRLIANKFRFSETKNTNAELHKYRVDSNSVLSFVDEYCTVEPNAETERSMFFEKYIDYCRDSNLQPVSQKTFNKDLEAAYPNVVRAKDKLGKRNTWRGIRYGQDD